MVGARVEMRLHPIITGPLSATGQDQSTGRPGGDLPATYEYFAKVV
jgi:hypothetical protein